MYHILDPLLNKYVLLWGKFLTSAQLQSARFVLFSNIVIALNKWTAGAKRRKRVRAIISFSFTPDWPCMTKWREFLKPVA